VGCAIIHSTQIAVLQRSALFLLRQVCSPKQTFMRQRPSSRSRSARRRSRSRSCERNSSGGPKAGARSWDERRRSVASPVRQGMGRWDGHKESERSERSSQPGPPVELKSRWQRSSAADEQRGAEDRRNYGEVAQERRPSWDSGKGGGKHGNLKPLPRPGQDEDMRLKQMADDPRYFKGAELGKAQKAALGITGLTGRNTASFDPKSTLVRPAMRVSYGPPCKKYHLNFKTDDVVIVPDFFCEEGNFDSYRAAVQEIKQVETPDDFDLSEMPVCSRAVGRLCKYLSLEDTDLVIRVAYYPSSSSDAEPRVLQRGGFDGKLQKHKNCVAMLALGAMREMASIRPETDESLFFPQENGAAMFFGKDACSRWKHGMNTYAASGQQATLPKRGHVSIMVLGRSSLIHEESLLAPAPSDEKKGRAAHDGRLIVPCETLARPSMRIITVPNRPNYGRPVRHDDVVIVPEFYCAENDWDIYYKLIEEMRHSQANGERKAEWIPWHEGAHLLSQNPTGSRTYQEVINRMCEYFSIAEGNRGTRFNWYRDGADWKPFHHDSAAFNEQRAKNQNTTIGISFGESRELAFRHAKTGELIYFPQKNGMLFYFGRDANIIWQHGINALPEEEQTGKGRISIILWGLCTTAVDEPGAPPMLSDESRGFKGKGGGKGGFSMHGDPQSNRSQDACRDYARGSCRFGDRCRFSHR